MSIAPPAPLPQAAGTPNGDVLLSICIPTYNRAPFLDYLLERFLQDYRLDFKYEIVISNNAATDNTEEVVAKYRDAGLPIVYYRQEENKGSLANLFNAYRRAHGRYVMYLADDDLINPAALSKVMAFLRENPEICAAYTPWDLYDAIAQKTQQQFFDLDEDRIFSPGQDMELLTLIINRHIFPEIVIYRSDAIHNAMLDSRFCFWAFSYLTHALAQGPVAFLKTSYYLSVTLTPVAPNRTQAGHEQTMTDWDFYRGGLEYFVYAFLRRTGRRLDDRSKLLIRDAIDKFVETRMRVALRLWAGRRDFLRVYELACRLSYLNPDAITTVEGIKDIPLLLGVQSLAWLANSIAQLERLVLVGASDMTGLEGLLRELGLAPRITVCGPPAAPTAHDLNTSLVFVTNESDRQAYVAQGYPPPLVVLERDLMSNVHLGAPAGLPAA